MTNFQIISIIFSGLALFGGIISVYVSMRIAVAKLEVHIKNIERDMLSKEVAILKIENNNREDHIRIIDKIDKLTDYVKK